MWLLSNVYYALDKWFMEIVKPVCDTRNTYCNMIRYADDFVCVFYKRSCAEEFYTCLQKRLGKFKLAVEPSKTKLLLFSKYSVELSESFTFLSFDFFMDFNSKGKPQVKLMTSKKKLLNSIQEFKEWIKKNRDN